MAGALVMTTPTRVGGMRVSAPRRAAAKVGDFIRLATSGIRIGLR